MHPSILLRLEGLAVLAGSGLAYFQLGFGGWWFFLLFLLPDVSMLGYAAGPRVGSALYNLGHNYVLVVVLGLLAWRADAAAGLGLALIWAAHIGFDRLLGYGLKFPSGFRDTHLQRVSGQPGVGEPSDKAPGAGATGPGGRAGRW